MASEGLGFWGWVCGVGGFRVLGLGLGGLPEPQIAYPCHGLYRELTRRSHKKGGFVRSRPSLGSG